MKREAVVKVRVNQGLFRETLLKRYNKCCLCGVSDEHFLVASHIKPWVVSESDEKLDPDNGFILCPNHDKAFDGGYITFADDGKIVISNGLTATDRMFLNIQPNMAIKLNSGNKKYLKYHKDNVFWKKIDNF